MPRASFGRVLLATGVAAILATGTAHAADADEDAPAAVPIVYWRTLETPHFRIHFYEAERPLAERATFLAERAFASLTRYLQWTPNGRIDISLIDATDSANGYASSLPSNYIYAYGVPPEPLFSLNDFDDWLNVLISHELTHVVHLDTILGLPRLVDTVFGKILAPNLVQPNWFIEGLAVLNESRVTTSGRIRSSLYDMYLRAAILEDRFHGIDAVSNGPIAFPQGEAAYLYGSHFLKYLEDRFGPEKLAELSHRYARRLLPFGLNRVAREVYGERYDQLWDDWVALLKRRYALQADEVNRKGLTVATRLTLDGEGAVGGAPSPGPSPHYLADGRGVVYLRATSFEHPAYVLYDPRTKQSRELWEAHSAGGSSPTPDGRGLVFAQLAPVPLPRRIGGNNEAASWDDLFHLDLASGELRQLTRGRRAHQPDVSPDGKRIACTIGTRTGTEELAVVPIDGGAPEVLLPNKTGEIAYSPAWSPDGKQIAYSRFKPGGYHDIHVLDVATRTDRALWVDRALDIEPRFSPDGRYVLWSSDRTGIYNIFAYELSSGRIFQVTNVLGGAFQPTVSPDLKTLVFTGFSAAGYDLYSIPYAPSTWRPAEPFVNARDDAPVSASTSADSVPTRESSYQPWRYLYPHHWGVPTITRNDLGLGTALTFTLGMNDPLNIHNVSATAQIPTAGDPSLALGYSYQRFWPSFGIGLTRAAATDNNNLIVDGQYRSYRQHAIVATAGVSLPVLRRADASGDLSFTYTRSDYGPADPFPVADPTAGITIPPRTGPDASVAVGWSYSNTHAWTRSISAQEGRTLELNLTIADPSLGGKYHTLSTDWSWREYTTMPWARLHVFALFYAGAISVGDHQNYYGLGGFVHQDLVRALFYQRRQCCRFLRGYPVNAVQGNQFHLVSGEYRLPLLLIEKGYSTFPLYLRQVYAAAFADVGNAFNDDFSRHGWRTGVGGELRLAFKLGYYFETLLQFGIAKGLSKGGTTDYYWVTSIPFF